MNTLSQPAAGIYPTDEESRKFEKIDTRIQPSSEEASFYVASELADLIRQRQKERQECRARSGNRIYPYQGL